MRAIIAHGQEEEKNEGRRGAWQSWRQSPRQKPIERGEIRDREEGGRCLLEEVPRGRPETAKEEKEGQEAEQPATRMNAVATKKRVTRFSAHPRPSATCPGCQSPFQPIRKNHRYCHPHCRWTTANRERAERRAQKRREEHATKEAHRQARAELHRHRCPYWVRGMARWLQERDRGGGRIGQGGRGVNVARPLFSR